MIGVELNDTQKESLKKLIGKCEHPNCAITEGLHVHRIHRGNKGGKYVLRNVMIVCDEHHKLFHHKEF